MSDGSGIKGAPAVSLVDLINELGPETVAEFLGPLTYEQEFEVDELVRKEHGGGYAAALGITDVELASQIDTLMGVLL